MKPTAVSNLAVQKLVTILHSSILLSNGVYVSSHVPRLSSTPLWKQFVLQATTWQCLSSKNGLVPTLRNSCSTQLFQISFISLSNGVYASSYVPRLSSAPPWKQFVLQATTWRFKRAVLHCSRDVQVLHVVGMHYSIVLVLETFHNRILYRVVQTWMTSSPWHLAVSLTAKHIWQNCQIHNDWIFINYSVNLSIKSWFDWEICQIL